MSSILNDKHFHDEAAAYKFVEARVWPEGPTCPHCGSVDRIGKLTGKSTRIGVYKCYACRKPFTVKVATVFEASHIPLHIWLQAMFLLSSSKKGISSNQLHRTLGVTLKSAWFLSHRIREAMRVVGFTPMGGEGKVVEVDETYSGDKDTITTRTIRGKSGHSSKRAIVSLVERGGSVRTFHVERADKETVTRIVNENVARESRLHTDESKLYTGSDARFAAHSTVKHSAGEYVRKDMEFNEDMSEIYITSVHTNTVEGVFSILKRGMHGVYQHCGEKHLHRYLAEFDFRYSNRIALGINDEARTDAAIRGVVGKRLTYRNPH